MLSQEEIATLRQRLANAIADKLTCANIDWESFDRFTEPWLRIEAHFQNRLSEDENAQRREQLLPGLIISVCSQTKRTTVPLVEC
jgi:hypothetical protein